MTDQTQPEAPLPARVAVLLGGRSPERPVSLVSGAAAAAAARRLGREAIEIDPEREDWIEALRTAAPEAVLNALHGAWGEDGRVQGVLEWLGLPYTHSGVLASALAMDKARAKTVFAAAGLDVPKGRVATAAEAAGGHLMPPPYVLKPNAQGSSVGVFIIRPGDNRPPAALEDPNWDLGPLLVEEFIPGRELTVAVLGDRGALGVTEIVPRTAFYDYEAKYAAGGSEHVLPAQIPESVATQALRAAETAHAAVGARGLTRSDFRWDEASGRLVILEINTQPGMTQTSLAPEQAAHVGIIFDDLIAWMLRDASVAR